MKKIFTFCVALLSVCLLSAQSDLVLTGVFDGPLPGGLPKGVELFVLNDIDDLSAYGIGAANNGGGTDGQEYTLPADAASAGSYIYVTNDGDGFMSFFGFMPTYVDDQMNSSVNVNGDDAIELFKDGEVVDIFGDIDTDGTGQAWEYLDGWVYRVDGTGPDGTTFEEANWTYSGINVFDNETQNSTAAVPFPIGTYSPMGSDVVIANDDFVNLPINESSDINVLANDLIPGTLSSLSIITNPTGGTASFMNDQIRYFPFQDFCGTDIIVYEVCDENSCDQATVSITIDCPASYPIYDIPTVTTVNSEGVVDSFEVTCTLIGYVVGINTRGSGLQFTIVDLQNNGINVFSPDETFDYTVQEGDEIVVQGIIDQFNGLTEIIPVDIMLVSIGSLPISPDVVSKPTEDTESSFIDLPQLSIVDPSQWGMGGTSGFNVDVTNGVDTFVMRIDNQVDVFNEPITALPNAGASFGVRAIGGQFDSSAPFTEGYQIQPQRLSDFYAVTSTVEPSFENAVTISPNPAKDVLTIEMTEQFEQISIHTIDGQNMLKWVPQNLNEQINVQAWPKGVYLITFLKDNKTWTSKLVK